MWSWLLIGPTEGSDRMVWSAVVGAKTDLSNGQEMTERGE